MSQSICDRHHSRRAFATILIMLLLFMMLLMAVAYLRTMRAYSLTRPRQTNADTAPVLAQLEADIAAAIGADGKIAPTSTETAPLSAADIHEPYDYPWTNSARFLAGCRLSYPKVLASAVGMGDPQVDDAWLSPCEVDASGKWGQVSNVMNSFLVYANANLTGIPMNAVTREHVPADAPAGKPIPDGLPASQQLAGGQSVAYQNLSASDARLVDTDGDGRGDALWFYPNKNLANGVRYIAAVRIVDLSGCVNLNTALAEMGGAPGSQSTIGRKGEGPYEVNPSKISASIGLTPASKSYRSRLMPGPGSFTATTDWDYWRLAGGQVGVDGQTSSSATGSRYGGISTVASPKLSDEAQLRDLSNKLASSTSLLPVPRLFAAPVNGNTGDYGALPSNAVRSRLTTISGAAEKVAWPTFTSWHFQPQLAGDLNLCQTDSASTQDPFWTADPAPQFFWPSSIYTVSKPAAPARVLQTFLGGPDNATPADDYPYPAGFRQLLTGGGWTSSDFAGQYQAQVGVCLRDALMRDNRPTVVADTAIADASKKYSWMGWKPLPALTEFYGEMPYLATAWNNAVRVNTTAVTAFRNTTLAQLKTVKAKMDPAFANEYNVDPYFWDTSVAGKITFQLQQYRSDGLTRAGLIELAQYGADVTARCLWYHYAAGNACGQDFTTLGVTLPGATTPTADGGAAWANQLFDLQVPLDQGSGKWASIYINTQNSRTTFSPNTAAAGDTRYGAAAGVGSYAFEVANPYAVPIRLANVRFQFRGGDSASFDELLCPNSTSAALDTYITAATALPGLPAKDAEGYFVLKPGEKAIFYRNGFENTNAPAASSDNASYAGALRPNAHPWQRFGGGPVLVTGTNTVDLIRTLFPSGLPANTYAVNLGTGTNAPDWNGHYNNRQVEHIELQVNSKVMDGTGAWMPYNRLTYITQPSGYNSYEFLCEGGIPQGGATFPMPGTLVYRQVNARTFGVEQKLNLLQARPPVIANDAPVSAPNSPVNGAPLDWGDCEFRSNVCGPVSGVLNAASGSQRPFPKLGSLSNGWWPGYQNTATTQPLSAAYGQYSASLCTLGQDVKIAFPGPNASNPVYGGQPRQDIKSGSLFFNYVGIPGDAAYPGTFPELASAAGAPWTSASTLVRDNALAGNNGAQRRDGTPHAMDIGRILMAGPVFFDTKSGVGNYFVRGGGASAYSTFNALPAVDQLVGFKLQNTIGDAINFYLAKDAQVAAANSLSPAGIKGLCLRTDKPFYDAAKVSDARLANKTLDQLYTDLSTALAAGNMANAAALRAGIRGMTHGSLSWGDAAESLFNVDDLNYKGKIAGNGGFRPGTINLNTAPQAVLNCLSLPAWVPLSGSPAVPSAFTAGILAARGDGASPSGPLVPTNAATLVLAPRKGLARVSELQNQKPSWFGLANAQDLWDAAAWLPQQASCRSDIYCAHILIQGYKQDDFNQGPIDVRRAIVIYSRGLTGAPATRLAEYVIPNR